MGEIVGYRRVSSTQQSLNRQDLPDVTGRIFEEKISAKSKDRPQLQEMLQYIRRDDEVHVHSIDRLARNLRDLEDIVNAIITKDASIRFIKEGLHFKPGVDDPFQQLMLQMLGSFAQFERSLMKARQQEGIDKAKAEGKFKGRGAVINEALVTDLLAYEVPAKDVCEWMDIGISSVYRIAEKRKKKSELHSKLTPEEVLDWASALQEYRENNFEIDDDEPDFEEITRELGQELLGLKIEVKNGSQVIRRNTSASNAAHIERDEMGLEKVPSSVTAYANGDYLALTKHIFEDPIWAEQIWQIFRPRHREAMELIYTRSAPDGSMDEERLGFLKYLGLKPSQVAEKMGLDAKIVEALWDNKFIKKPSWAEWGG